MIDIPVLFLVFNRPNTTKEVFEAIRAAKPTRLYLASDGPRPGHPTDEENCRQVKEIVSSVDWECEVKTLYRDNNLGCGGAVSQAISWFFENEPEGIILEDDTLPNRDFFDFCGVMLDLYRDQPKVALISGDNFQYGVPRGSASYYYSIYTHFWGWASWRRTWDLYDIEMKKLPELLNSDKLIRQCCNEEEVAYWTDIFNRVSRKEIDCWGYQLQFETFLEEALTVIPNRNMISNIGFGDDATHTSEENFLSNIPRESYSPITSPGEVTAHREADAYTFRYLFQHRFASEELMIREIAEQFDHNSLSSGLTLCRSARQIYPSSEALQKLENFGLQQLGFRR